jgi:uncharacterized protein (DUF58 family)
VDAPPSLDWKESGKLVWLWRAPLALGLSATAFVLAVEISSAPLLLFGLPFLVAPVLALVVLPSKVPRVKVRTHVETEPPPVRFRLEVQTDPALAGSVLEISQLPPEGARADPDREGQALAIGPEGRGSVEGSWTISRPVYSAIPPPVVRWTDPLRMLSLELPVEAEAATLEVYPPETLRITRLPFRRTLLLPGESKSRARAPQGDFLSVRPYQSSDSLRQINWAATARTGSLHSNEYQAERLGEVVLALDARPAPGAEGVLSVGRALALGLARSLLRGKIRVGLVLFGEFPDCLPLGSGPVQRVRLESRLQRARVAEVGAPLERLGVALSRHYRPGTFILWISPLTDPEAPEIGAVLPRRGFPVLVLSPSPLALRVPSSTPEGRLAHRLEALQRRQVLDETWAGAPVVDWKDLDSLAPLLSYFREMGRIPGAYATGL